MLASKTDSGSRAGFCIKTSHSFSISPHKNIPPTTMHLLKITLILVTCAVLVSPSIAAEETNRPLNFVVILVDDMGWTDLTCQGSGYYETPNIDRLAAGGMRFTNGYAACAVCSPTRAAMMTGRYPARIGVTDWIRAKFQRGKSPKAIQRPEYKGGSKQSVLCPTNPYWMEHEEVTIPEALAPAGYTSCHVGKWHLGIEGYFPEKQGFAFNHGGCDLGQPPSYFDPFKNPRYDMPTLAPRKKGEYLTDREADEAVGFLRAHCEKPFFLYLAHYAVHTPIQAKSELVEKYQKKPKTNHKNATYAAMVESVDDATGRVLETLDELGLTERTIVVFTSDNGGLCGPTNNRPLRWGKGHAYEGGIRVPWIIRWPGVTKPGTVSDVPICTIDVLPTVLAAADVGLPSGQVIDGLDLRPTLEGGKLARNALYWHFPHYGGDQRRPYSIIRQDDWKLIRRYDTGTHELFNLADDLGEKNDLAKKMHDKVATLDEQLTKHLESVGAKLPKPNPTYRAEK